MPRDGPDAAPRQRGAIPAGTAMTADAWVAKYLAEAPPLTDERWQQIAALITARPVRREQDRSVRRTSVQASR